MRFRTGHRRTSVNGSSGIARGRIGRTDVAYWLDDGWHSWPEVVRAGTAAAGLYARCGCYIAGNIERLRDAVVPVEVARMFGTPEWIQRLVDVGLWRTEEAGYRDMKYFPLNPTVEKVEQRKRQAADRQARYRKTRQSRGSNASRNGVSTLPPAPLKGGGLVEPHPYPTGAHECDRCTLPPQHSVHRLVGGPS
jgi:hypothetical protein